MAGAAPLTVVDSRGRRNTVDVELDRLMPDHVIEPAGYRAGRDPVLEAALRLP